MMPDFMNMSERDLMAFWYRYTRASRKDAEALIGDRRKGFTTLAATIANYACNLAVVLSCARKGHADSAAIYATHVRMIWERLPTDIQAAIKAPSGNHW